MLTKVEVYTERGQVLELPLRIPKDGYIVKSIDGLNPNKANVVSSSFALLDGAQFQAARGQSRNIVLSLDYDKRYQSKSVAQLRSNLYGYLMPKAKITLRFYTDEHPVVDIVGWVETFDTPIFSREPTVATSIMCFEPHFYTRDLFRVTGNTTPTNVTDTIEYNGSVESGFVFKMTPTRVVDGFTISRNFANGVGSTLEFGATVKPGELIEIDTTSGNKGAWITDSSGRKSALYGVSPDSEYVNLYPGSNTMTVFVNGSPMPYTIDYRERFGGL